MSELLREGAPLDKNRGTEVLTSFKRQVADALNDPIVQQLLLKQFKEYMVQYLALNQPPISISQVFGFNQFTAQTDFQGTAAATTTSVTYTDLSDGAGPQLTGLPDGQYLFWFGGTLKNATNSAFVSIDVNGAGATDAEGTFGGQFSGYCGVSRGITKTLNGGGNNTVTLKYRVTGGTGEWWYRSLIALRFGN